MKIIVQEGQSIWDVCIQHTGSVESVFSVLNENGKEDTNVVIGEELIINKILNQKVHGFFSNNQIIPASMSSEDLNNAYVQQNYWENNYTE